MIFISPLNIGRNYKKAIVSYHFYGPSMSYARVAGLQTQKMLKKISPPPLKKAALLSAAISISVDKTYILQIWGTH